MPFGDTSKFTLEVCCSSIESLILAQTHGADRIELCQNLEQGGITPSYGMIKEAIKKAKVPVHVLIRPRPGDFKYSDDEVLIQSHDIEMCRDLGCAGVVIGLEGPIDLLTRHVGDMQITYNRHFDDMSDSGMQQRIEEIVHAGCHRLLTSGGAPTAEEGIQQLKTITQQANGRVQVMAGSGITSENVVKIIQETGIRQIHASCKRVRPQDYQHDSRGYFHADEIVVATDLLDRLVEAVEKL